MKKFFLISAALVLCLSLTAMPAFGAKRTTMLEFISSDAAKSDAAEGWAWSGPDTKTLTLDGFHSEDAVILDIALPAIALPEGSIIVINGVNTIKNKLLALLSMGNLTIKGAGSLKIECDGIGIGSEKDIEIQSGTLDIEVRRSGIMTTEGNVIISGGTLKMEVNCYGLAADKGNVTFSGGVGNIISKGGCPVLSREAINISSGVSVKGSLSDKADGYTLETESKLLYLFSADPGGDYSVEDGAYYTFVSKNDPTTPLKNIAYGDGAGGGGDDLTLKVRFQGRTAPEANIENLTVKWIKGNDVMGDGETVTTSEKGEASITLPQ